MTMLNEFRIKDFLKKAVFIANKSSCGYKVGCVGLIEDKNFYVPAFLQKDENFRRKAGFIYLKTWNETLKGEIYCQNMDVDGCKICVRESEKLKGREYQKVCSIHAEANLVSKFASAGLPTIGMYVFLTNSPCYICAKTLIQAKISNVYYVSEHTETLGIDILRANGVECSKVENIFES